MYVPAGFLAGHSVVVCGHRSPALVTLFVCMCVSAGVAGALGHNAVVCGNGFPTGVALFVCVCVFQLVWLVSLATVLLCVEMGFPL